MSYEFVTNFALVRARAGRSEALGAQLIKLARLSRIEAGCIDFDVHPSESDPELWMVTQVWRSRAAYQAHLLTPAVRRFLGRARGLVQGDVDLKTFRPTAPSMMVAGPNSDGGRVSTRLEIRKEFKASDGRRAA